MVKKPTRAEIKEREQKEADFKKRIEKKRRLLSIFNLEKLLFTILGEYGGPFVGVVQERGEKPKFALVSQYDAPGHSVVHATASTLPQLRGAILDCKFFEKVLENLVLNDINEEARKKAELED